MSEDTGRILQLSLALRSQLQVLVDLEGLDAASRVRLAASLLADALLKGRIAGAGRATLDMLVREGEELALNAFSSPGAGTADARQPVLSSLLASPMRLESSGSADAAASPLLDVDALGEAGGAPQTEAGEGPGAPLPSDTLFDELFESMLSSTADAPSVQAAAAPPSAQAAEEPMDLPLDAITPLGVHDALHAPVSPELKELTGKVDLTPFLRRQTRFEARDLVVVELVGREDLKELYTRDVSKGGMFIATDDPPPMGSMLNVALETPDGALSLAGRVVHVVAPQQASVSGSQAGVGVQFDPLEAKKMSLLERYIEGLAQRLDAPPPVDLSGPAGTARALRAHADNNRLYDAIGATPSSSEAQLAACIESLRAVLAAAETAAQAQGDEAEGARLTAALRTLDRIAGLLKDRLRRLAYDFEFGHERIEERLKDAAAGRVKLPELVAVWRKVHQDRAIRAAALVNEALFAEKARDLVMAAAKATEARALDPFNVPLRERAAGWQKLADVVAAMRGEQKSPEEWQRIAKTTGLSLDALRELWAAEKPKEAEHAKQLARRALQAETIKRYDAALQSGREAYACDPFNAALRDTLIAWERNAAHEASKAKR